MTTDQRLAVAFLETHPREAALAIERLSGPERVAVLQELPPDAAASALRSMGRASGSETLAQLESGHAARLVGALSPDESADLLRRLPADARDRIVGAMHPAARERVARMLRFPEGTAAALMDPSILDLPADISVAEAQERVRAATHGLLYYLYVVDADRRLVGVLDIPELMSARPSANLRAVMHERVERLSAWAPPSVIRTHDGWRGYHAMPVVDEEGRLLGAIRYQTLRRLEQEAPVTGPAPATMTALALGELFHLGVTGLAGSLAARASTDRAAVRGPADRDASREVQRG